MDGRYGASLKNQGTGYLWSKWIRKKNVKPFRETVLKYGSINDHLSLRYTDLSIQDGIVDELTASLDTDNFLSSDYLSVTGTI